jgi:hypothetical protein
MCNLVLSSRTLTFRRCLAMSDRDRSPRRGKTWPRRMQHLALGDRILILQDEGPPLVVGPEAVAATPAKPATPTAADAVQHELLSLRMEIRELWRRVRSLEAAQDGACHDLRFLNEVAVTAQRRWRILR